ncbi:mCG147786 [Mus musculus]|nr:mCG147786 [Mus musculus]
MAKTESRCGSGFVTLFFFFFFFCLPWTLAGGMRPGSRKQKISSERRKSAAPDTAGAPSSSGISNERPRLTSVFQMKTSVHLQDTENLQLLGQRLLRTHLPWRTNTAQHLPSVCLERS